MLGRDGIPESGADALDVFDELRLVLEKGGSGNIGGDNDGGGSGNGGGGDGEDPLKGQPIDARILLDALKQMAQFTRDAVLSAMKQQAGVTTETAEFLTDAIIKGREADQERMLEVAKQQHGTALEAMRATTRLAAGVADRFEAAEKRISTLERELTLLQSASASADADVGGGP
jgi:hypothetical protein